jgi:TrmH family RNA methyltransferase
MVAKSEIKFIRSLQLKKNRQREGLFVAEGIKLVSELLQSKIRPYRLFTTESELLEGDFEQISEPQLKKMSSLVQPNKVLGVFKIPEAEPPRFQGWTVVLDGVRDPGNLGTIIRLCDWFGIPELLCSTDTVDCYNPKVLQATMGSIARVRVSYGRLDDILKEIDTPIFGASMEGRPLPSEILPDSGILVMGSESHGISEGLKNLVNKVLSIPSAAGGEAESLNVATATAIFLYAVQNRNQGATQK